MEELKFTEDDVFTAYRYLKNFAYFDNSSYYLKDIIVKFEGENTLDSIMFSFSEIADQINEWLADPKLFEESIESQIRYLVYPKKITTKEQSGDSCNFKIDGDDDFVIDRISLFIDTELHIHLISVLWTMHIGYKLANDLSKNCYAYKCKLQETKKDQFSLFEPYFVQYSNWRDKALETAEQQLDNKHDVLLLCLDIKD